MGESLEIKPWQKYLVLAIFAISLLMVLAPYLRRRRTRRLQVE